MPEIAPAYDEALAQWFTPPKLAKRIAERFLPHNATVLEPTAGGGSLVQAAIDADAARVCAVEIDPRWVTRLQARFEGAPVTVHAHSFFDIEGAEGIDTILMNPPDNKASGLHVVDFLEHALNLSGWSPWCDVVALIRAAALYGVERAERVWSRASVSNIVHLARRPAYGDSDSGGKQDWCVVRFRQGPPRDARPEWWTEAWT
jgi:predicted RNA methylase